MDDKGLELLKCPSCAGASQLCRVCAGDRVGVWLDGRWLYAEPKLSSFTLAAVSANTQIEKAINYLSYSLASLSMMTVMVWVLINLIARAQNNQDLLSLFTQPSHWLLLACLAIILGLFSFYRLSKQAERAKKIKAWKIKANQQAWPERRRGLEAINVADAWQDDLQSVWLATYKLASDWHHSEVTVLHLFVALAQSSSEAQTVLSRLKVDPSELFSKLGHQLTKLATAKSLSMSTSLAGLMIKAYARAYQNKALAVGALELLSDLWGAEPLLDELLYDLGIDADKWANVLVWSELNKKLLLNYRRYRRLAAFKPSGNMDRAYTAMATPLLDQYAYDLTLAAKYGQLDICVGREAEMQEIFASLQAAKTGIILVGEPGVGKRELVAGLAQLMVTEEVPERLSDKRLLELDLASLLAGATAAGAQEKMLVLVNELARAGNIVLFIKDLENLMGISSGNEGSLELAEVLVNAVTRNGLVCLASTSPTNYHDYIEGSAVAQSFVKLELAEPTGNQAIVMIESKISWLEAKYKVYFSYEAISSAVELSDRYMHESFLPAKAISILEKAAVTVANKGRDSAVGAADVASELSRLTHINVQKLASNEGVELLNLENKMHERMIGQVEAVTTISQSLRRARAELRTGKRPIASFLFLGPTGVGKTELAKTLAAVYFGGEEYMIRLDMSEYQASDALAKMIGADGQSGYLTEKVRSLPFTLVLLDEIEKAHPEILNLFLQVLDDGRLTDGLGRTIDFTNTIIIATSNVGAVYIQEQVKAGTDLPVIKDNLIERELVAVMRPELINRFDGIIVFKPLAISEVAQIAALILKELAQMLEAKGIALVTSPGALDSLASLAYQPEFGARPLRRLIQDRIENEIANKILAGELARRDKVLINERAEIEVQKARSL